jgi:capsular exopolysaccharide synthesis family protein
VTRASSDDLDLLAASRVLRSRIGWFLGPLLIIVVLALLITARQTPMYRSSTDLLLRAKATDAIASGVEDPSSIDSDNYYSDRVLATEIQVLNSQRVADAASKRLGFPAFVTAVGDPTAAILRIVATDEDPQRAALVANTYADVYREFRRDQTLADIAEATGEFKRQTVAYQQEIDRLTEEIARSSAGDPETTVASPAAVEVLRSKRDAAERQRDSYQEKIDALTVDASLKSRAATVLTPAVPATAPSSPRPFRNALAGMIAGLVLGLAAAFLREFLDDRIRSVHDAARFTPLLNVLGAIPRARRSRSKNTSAGAVPAESLEAYRSLRSAVTFLGIDDRMQVILVTSAAPAEGKSTTTANLARVWSQAGLRVLVVDADLRNPSIHEHFGLPNDIGFSSLLAGQTGIASAARTLSDEGDLTVMAAGPIPPNPAELLGSWRAKDVFGAVRSHFDVILVDTPPVLAVTDPVVAAQFADGVLLVARARKTRRSELSAALELLQRSNTRVIGCVLNGMRRRTGLGLGAYGYGTTGYGAYGKYTYGYGKNKKRRKIPRVQPSRTIPAWVPDDSPIWSAAPGETWVPRADRVKALQQVDDSLNHTAELSPASGVQQVPNDPSALNL